MAIDAWPNTLPQRLQLEGASQGVGDGLVENQPDYGPPLVRRRTAAVVKPLSGSMICSADQVADFVVFFETTLAGGALPFTFPDPLGGADLLVRISTKSLPTWSPLGGDNFRLQLTLLVLP